MFGIQKDGTYRAERAGVTNVSALPAAGYAVAYQSVQREADVLPGDLFGRWTDPLTNKVYWDLVEHFEDLDDALTAARHRGELAIWDFAHNTAIEL